MAVNIDRKDIKVTSNCRFKYIDGSVGGGEKLCMLSVRIMGITLEERLISSTGLQQANDDEESKKVLDVCEVDKPVLLIIVGDPDYKNIEKG